MDKEYREMNMDANMHVINELSYLKDAEKLKEHIETRKYELKQEIIRIQTLTIEELVDQKLTDTKKYYFNPTTIYKQVREIKECALEFVEEGRGHESDEFLYEIPANEIIKMSDQDIFIMVKKDFDNRIFQMIQQATSEFEEKKKKYAGITGEELEEYVDLLVNKEVLESKIMLKRSEMDLEYLKKHPRKEESRIVYIEELEAEMEIQKQNRKESLGIFIKLAVATGAISSVLMLSTGVDVLDTLIVALSSFPAVIGLYGALYGIGALVNALNNKKVVKKLKEAGFYDLYLEKIGAEKQIDQFEVEKGMRL